MGLPLVLLAVVLLGSGVVALPIALSLLRRLRELETKQKLQESRLRRLEGPAPSDATFARPASAPAPAMTSFAAAVAPPAPAPPAPTASSPPPAAPPLTTPRPVVPIGEAFPKWQWRPRSEKASGFDAAVAWVVDHWLLVAGALVLQLGIAFGVKYSFEQGWIDERVRVVGGIAIGLVLAGLSFLRRVVAIKPLSETLLAAGVTSLYFSGFAAWHFYRLVPVQVALGFLASVSLLSTIVATARDLPLTAHLAVIGAYLAPPLFARNEDQQLALFLYVFVASCGALLLFARKPWPGVAWIAAISTAILAGLWFVAHFTPAKMERSLELHALVLAPVMALPFARLRGRRAGAHEVGLAAWAALHAALVCAAHCAPAQQWTLAGKLYGGLAAWHGLLALALRRLAPTQRSLRRTYEAIALALVPAAAAAAFDGSPVTLVLAAQAVGLAWVASRGPAPIARIGSLLASGAVAARLLAGIPHLPLTAPWLEHEKLFASSLAAVVLLYFTLRWLRLATRQEADSVGWLEETSRSLVLLGVELAEIYVAAALGAVAWRLLEAAHREFQLDDEVHFALGALVAAAIGLGLVGTGARFRRTVRLVLGGLVTFSAVAAVALLGAARPLGSPRGPAPRLPEPLLNAPVGLSAAALLLAFFARRSLRTDVALERSFRSLLAVALLVAPLAVLWGEWERLVDLRGWSAQRSSAGTSILIGLYATALLAASRGRTPLVRVVALVLYGLLLGKMIFIDLAAMETLGRVISFVVVGVLLLVAWLVVRRRSKPTSSSGG